MPDLKPELPSQMAETRTPKDHVSRDSAWMLVLTDHTLHLCGPPFSAADDPVPQNNTMGERVSTAWKQESAFLDRVRQLFVYFMRRVFRLSSQELWMQFPCVTLIQSEPLKSQAARSI